MPDYLGFLNVDRVLTIEEVFQSRAKPLDSLLGNERVA